MNDHNTPFEGTGPLAPQGGFSGDSSGLTPELAAIDAALAELAGDDLMRAGPRFEDRIALATAPVMARAETPEVTVLKFPSQSARPAARSGVWRVAAVVTLAATAGLTWMAVRPGITQTSRFTGMEMASRSVEQDVDSWLRITDSSSEDLKQLAMDSDSLDRALASEPSAGEWFLDGEPL